LLRAEQVRVDAHTHIFPPSFAARRSELASRDRTFAELYHDPKARLATAEELVAALDTAGFDAAIAAGIGWTDLDTAREANDYALESAAKHPGRISPFCSVNPAWGDAALREVERCAKAGARGVGELHPDTQGFRLDDIALLTPFAQEVEKRRMVLLTHVSEPVGHMYPGKGRTAPEQALAFVQAFPQLRIIMAHWGGGLPFYALMPEVANALKNVWFDSAASPYLYQPRVLRVMAELVGSDKMLFGTDFPLVSHRRAVRDLDASGLPEEARAKVLGGNAAGLFGLGGT
jgi:predicted TIM-barrel fold metal-dependent hydrolase